MEVADSDLQVRLHYKPWRMEDVDIAGSGADGVTRVTFKDNASPGFMQVGTGYTNFDEYALTALEVHAPSEHTFRHASWPLEVQLWHKPMSLLRISKLAESIADLTNHSQQSDAKIDSMTDIDKDLRDELGGEVSPWSLSGQADRTQTLDWIDATKRHIVKEAAAFRSETSSHLRVADRIAEEVSDVAAAQRRKYASHEAVISVFILKMPQYAESSTRLGEGNETAGSELVRWISRVLAGEKGGPLDAEQVMISSSEGGRKEMYGYPGSLTRPPCTPDVRWFVLAQPLAAFAEDLVKILSAARVSFPNAADASVLGDGRDIQPIGQSRKLERILLSAQTFGQPALALPEMVSPGAQKWAFVKRYGKVFLMCASLLLFSPVFFVMARKCNDLQDQDEEAENFMSSKDKHRDVVAAAPQESRQRIESGSPAMVERSQ